MEYQWNSSQKQQGLRNISEGGGGVFETEPSGALDKHLIGHWSGEKVLITLDNSFADVDNDISDFLA